MQFCLGLLLPNDTRQVLQRQKITKWGKKITKGGGAAFYYYKVGQTNHKVGQKKSQSGAKITKWRITACKSYGGGNLIVILNDFYFFYLVLAGNNEPFRVTPSKSSG